MNESEILAKTYFDVATIKRKEKIKDIESGVTKLEDVSVYENINCAISKNDKAKLISGEVQNINTTFSMFTRPDVIIKAGDTVEVQYENGLSNTFIAGKPFFYKSHSEVPLELKERV